MTERLRHTLLGTLAARPVVPTSGDRSTGP